MAQDHVGGGAGGRRRVRSEGCKKAVGGVAGVSQAPDDLAIVVDVLCKGKAVHNGIVDGGENAPAIEEGVGAARVRVLPDDLTGIVDTKCLGSAGKGQRIVDGGVIAAAQEEAVGAAGVAVPADDLAQVVDAKCLRAKRGRGIIEGGVIAAAK